MAITTAGIRLGIQVAGLRELQQELGTFFEPKDRARILRSAMNKALNPLLQRLRQVTPVGPTGNMRRAIAKKVVTYPSGNASGLVGFRQAGRGGRKSAGGGTIQVGPDRAYHQWWLEKGTRERNVNSPANRPFTRKAHTRRHSSGKVFEVGTHQVKQQGGYIASSFNELGPFTMEKTPKSEGRVRTNPATPRAFFKKSATPIVIPAMNPGGSGEPPMTTAWNQTKETVAQILASELRITLQRAASTLVAKIEALDR